jgi:hypothetical protein
MTQATDHTVQPSGVDDFFARHRGGSGNVILTIAVNADGDQRHGIHSDIEKARGWSEKLGDDWSCVHSPYVVDEPDYGNATQQ